jgi:molecular chaperone GrpE
VIKKSDAKCDENCVDEKIDTSNETSNEEKVNEAFDDETSTQDIEDTHKDEDKAESTKKEKKSKSPKKDKKDLMIEELNDKYMRTFAEFDNFRKRTEKEKAAMFEVGAKSIVEKILPVVDNFERGFAVISEEEMETPFIQGMDKVYKQLIASLEEAGVKSIEAVGAEFNPDFHNAVMHVEDDNYEENIVVEEFQKGYMFRESVVRHSMVKVAN